jgi:hypothetical protein
MQRSRSFVLAALVAAVPSIVSAQDARPLPAAGSDQAAAMLTQSIEKTLAFARGEFRSTESTDAAMLRGMGAPGGASRVVTGGWMRHLLWGESGGQQFVRAHGRMIAKGERGWRLKKDSLGDGRVLPFALDPPLLCRALLELPAAARRVVDVAPGTVAGREVAVLAIEFDGEEAWEFAATGAVPVPQGGFAVLVMPFGDAQDAPRTPTALHLAFTVDVETGDLLRFGMKAYSKDGMVGGFALAFGAPVADAAEGGEEVVVTESAPEPAEAAPPPPPVWRDGLPVRAPNPDETVLTYVVDFSRLGLAEAPKLDERMRLLLGY